MPRAGQFKDKIEVQKLIDTKDSTGHKVETWEIYIAGRCADIKPLKPREFNTLVGDNAEMTATITCRYDALLAETQPDYRIIDKRTNYIYQVIGFPQNIKNENRYLVFSVKRLARD